MIFPPKDRALLTQELGTYGITYADGNDWLIIAPELKGHPELVPEMFGYTSPLETVAILCVGEELVGAIFPSVTHLISHFWNGTLPEEILTEHIADLMDLGSTDLKRQRKIRDCEVLLQARIMNESVRIVIRESESLPRAIVERIRDNLDEFKDTVH